MEKDREKQQINSLEEELLDYNEPPAHVEHEGKEQRKTSYALGYTGLLVDDKLAEDPEVREENRRRVRQAIISGVSLSLVCIAVILARFSFGWIDHTTFCIIMLIWVLVEATLSRNYAWTNQIVCHVGLIAVTFLSAFDIMSSKESYEAFGLVSVIYLILGEISCHIGGLITSSVNNLPGAQRIIIKNINTLGTLLAGNICVVAAANALTVYEANEVERWTPLNLSIIGIAMATMVVTYFIAVFARDDEKVLAIISRDKTLRNITMITGIVGIIMIWWGPSAYDMPMYMRLIAPFTATALLVLYEVWHVESPLVVDKADEGSGGSSGNRQRPYALERRGLLSEKEISITRKSTSALWLKGAAVATICWESTLAHYEYKAVMFAPVAIICLIYGYIKNKNEYKMMGVVLAISYNILGFFRVDEGNWWGRQASGMTSVLIYFGCNLIIHLIMNILLVSKGDSSQDNRIIAYSSSAAATIAVGLPMLRVVKEAAEGSGLSNTMGGIYTFIFVSWVILQAVVQKTYYGRNPETGEEYRILMIVSRVFSAIMLTLMLVSFTIGLPTWALIVLVPLTVLMIYFNVDGFRRSKEG